MVIEALRELDRGLDGLEEGVKLLVGRQATFRLETSFRRRASSR
jgi:hypothetical protein